MNQYSYASPFSGGIGMGEIESLPYPVSTPDVPDVSVVNCYYLADRPVSSSGTQFTDIEMRSPSFIDMLNSVYPSGHSQNVIPAWVADTENINGGFPITIANQNYEKGIYKIQPELWLHYHGPVIMSVGSTRNIAYETYFNESPLAVTASDDTILSCSLDSGTLKVTALQPGETYINFHFDETENSVAADYQLKVTIESEHQLVDGVCTGCGKNVTYIQEEDNALTVYMPGFAKGRYIVTALYRRNFNSETDCLSWEMVTCFVDAVSDEPLVYQVERIGDWKTVNYCKVFILDENFIPLCEEEGAFI